MAEHGRGDVVRQIRDDDVRRSRAGSREHLARRHAEHIRFDDRDAGVGGETVAQAGDEVAVDLDRDDVPDTFGEHRREGAATRADLDHRIVVRQSGGIGDAIEDVRVGEEMLTEALLRARPRVPGARRGS